MNPKNCETCLLKDLPHSSVECATCGQAYTNYVAEFDENRIDVIAQNGNGGEHYDDDGFRNIEIGKTPPDSIAGIPVIEQKQHVIRIIPTKVIAIDATDDILFTLEAFDEFTATIDIKTILGKGNIKEITDAMIAALDVMRLE
jgi:hypothetical protein